MGGLGGTGVGGRGGGEDLIGGLNPKPVCGHTGSVKGDVHKKCLHK